MENGQSLSESPESARSSSDRQDTVQSGRRGAVAVIVPAYNPGPELAECIDLLLAQDIDEPFEIVVVDNGSEPAIVPRWDSRVRLIEETSPGSYAARNAGIRATSAAMLAFTDADCLPERDWLQAGVAALRSGASVAAGRIDLFGQTPHTAAELFEFRYAFPQERYLEEGFGVTANLFVRRDVIETAGPFDATLKSGGDREFGQRLAAAGCPTVFVEEAMVLHPARRTLRELLAKTMRTTAGSAALQRRRQGSWGVLREAIVLLRPPLRAVRNILREERGLSYADRLRICGVLLLVRWTAAWTRVRSLIRAPAPR